MQETHPFILFAPENSRILFVGTFPPTKRNWSYEFFYPNKQNLFWKVMASIAGTELRHFTGAEGVEERKNILRQLNVAITDMGHTIIRNDNSSLDENLAIVTYMDIFNILDNHPSITKIIFTSSSGPVSAARWFNEYLKSKNIVHRFPAGLKPLKSQFLYNGKMIQLSVLYSPSRRAANRISFDQLVAMYKAEIFSS
jgi:G:T/U-mismatch repair DNA glycosylase